MTLTPELPAGFEIIDLHRRYAKAEMERLSQGDSGMKFIAVQNIEEADACYVIDPSNFGYSSDRKYA